jgi:hypothetical protein
MMNPVPLTCNDEVSPVITIDGRIGVKGTVTFIAKRTRLLTKAVTA